MKIIRHGKVKEPKMDMIAECNACGCVFIFGANESNRYSNNGGGSIYFAKCPESGCPGQGSYDTGYPEDKLLDQSVKTRISNLRELARIS